jgi:hypothetical protein
VGTNWVHDNRIRMSNKWYSVMIDGEEWWGKANYVDITANSDSGIILVLTGDMALSAVIQTTRIKADTLLAPPFFACVL